MAHVRPCASRPYSPSHARNSACMPIVQNDDLQTPRFKPKCLKNRGSPFLSGRPDCITANSRGERGRHRQTDKVKSMHNSIRNVKQCLTTDLLMELLCHNISHVQPLLSPPASAVCAGVVNSSFFFVAKKGRVSSAKQRTKPPSSAAALQPERAERRGLVALGRAKERGSACWYGSLRSTGRPTRSGRELRGGPIDDREREREREANDSPCASAPHCKGEGGTRERARAKTRRTGSRGEYITGDFRVPAEQLSD